MIRCIVAVDSKNGIATENGIPWDLPKDRQYFRSKTVNSTIVMGFGMYQELAEPLPDRRNIVVVREGTKLRPGFEKVTDVIDFLRSTKEDVWVVGGAKIYQATISMLDELYITQIDGDFHCTKFFPEYTDAFRRVDSEPSQTDNGINFTFTHWKRTTHLLHKQR
jgi:dihydrofolate reductase